MIHILICLILIVGVSLMCIAVDGRHDISSDGRISLGIFAFILTGFSLFFIGRWIILTT